MTPLADRALSDVNALEARKAKELEAKAVSEIAHAKKFWARWDDEARSAKVFIFTSRASELQAKSAELRRGLFDAQHDYSALVMLYVTAIRELTGNHFAL